MVAYPNDLMMAVIVAATALAGLTVVMVAYIIKMKSIVRISRLSLGCGLLAVVFAILWFYLGQLEWVASMAVVLLILQISTVWVALEEFLISRQPRR